MSIPPFVAAGLQYRGRVAASPRKTVQPPRRRPMTTKVRAAQYVRMSTDHQQFSTENQADIIRDYAAKHGIEIVRTFEDSGKSGLTTQGRDAITELLELVRAGKAD